MEMCKTPCEECPFRRTAMKGYLGSYDNVDHFFTAHVQADNPNPCHMTMDYSIENWQEEFNAGVHGKLCKGQAIFYANMCKIDRYNVIPRVRRNIKTIFQWAHEFLEYHSKKRKEKNDNSSK